jgi:hypothetical protein
MELFMKVSISMPRKMAMEFIPGQTIEFMKGGGSTVSNMA